MKLKSLLRSLRRKTERLLSLKTERSLFLTMKTQEDDFLQLSQEFPVAYNTLKMQSTGNFITPHWNDYNRELEGIFLPFPPFAFLRNSIIKKTMFVDAGGNWLAEQIGFLEKALSRNQLKNLLREDYVGKPIVRNIRYLTSHNSIHQLYHLINFQEKTKVKISDCNTVVEWGGGYGGMAKIVKRMNPKIGYTIIDTPLFSCLQWLYLATIFGEKNVNLLVSPESTFHDGKINLLPISLVDHQTINADLFISTWALSESSVYSQDYAVNHNWFNSKHLLLAYHDSHDTLPNSGRLGELAMSAGAVIDDVKLLPGNHYAFH